MALAKGSKGDEVRALQQFLLDLGYDLGTFGPNKDGIDGDFGSVTQAALRQYQEDNGMEVTGRIEGSFDDFVASTQTTGGTEEGGTTDSVDAGGGVTVSEGAPEEESQAGEGVGTGGEDPELQLTILTGEEMNWYFDENTGKWYVGYGLPNSNREAIFEATPGQMDALFGDGFRPETFSRTTLQGILNRTETTFGGNIAEMEGTGSFEGQIARVTSIALDNGVLPPWAEQDGAAMDIIYIAQMEGKTNDWVLQQLSQTQGFQERFPNLQQFQSLGNLTLVDAITGFLDMEAGVRMAIQATGGDTGVVSPEIVGGLLSQGHSLTTVQNVTRTFKRMEENQGALDAFNQVLAQQGQTPLTTLEEMFNFVNGTASADLYNLWEASSIQEAANAVGLGGLFGADDAINLAIETPGTTTAADVAPGLQQAASLILRLRHELNVEEFGLTVDDVIDVSLGRAPASGLTQSVVQENINRAMLAAQANVKTRRATPFTGFTQQGTPQAQSLANLRTQE